MKRRIGVGLFLAVAVVTVAFLALPIVGIFVHTSPGKLLDQLSNPVVKDAFVVSLKTSAIAQALILLFGTPTAYLLATRRFPGHSLAVTLVELPLVLPPAVAGIGLLAALGREGMLGSSLRRIRRLASLHAERGHGRSRLCSEPALHPPGDRLVRGDRSPPGRSLAHARRRTGTHLLPRRAAARPWRACRRPRALLRARARRVRGDDHVRRQPAEASPRPCRWRSTPSSTRTSTPPWRWAACSS